MKILRCLEVEILQNFDARSNLKFRSENWSRAVLPTCWPRRSCNSTFTFNGYDFILIANCILINWFIKCRSSMKNVWKFQLLIFINNIDMIFFFKVAILAAIGRRGFIFLKNACFSTSFSVSLITSIYHKK